MSFEIRNFIIHIRPLAFLITFPIFLTGFVLGGYSSISNLIFGGLSVIVLIQGGTLAFNSYYDKDKGPVNLLMRPPKPTRSLLVFAIVFKALGILLSLFINLKFFIVCVSLVLMSVLYSHPRFRFKTKHGLDMVMNGAGYGSLFVLGGWLCSTPIMSIKIILLSIIAFLIVSAAVPLAEIFQYKQEKDRTFVVIFGPKKSLLISILLLVISLIALNGFLLLYFKPVFNLILSAVLLAAILFAYYWYRNIGKVDDVKFLRVCYVFFTFGWLTFSLLMLLQP